MKTFLILLTAICSLQVASAQTSASLAADLQAVDPAHWPAINALLVAQRNELSAVHVASLTEAAADFTSKLTASNAARDTAIAKLSDLQTRITTVLNAQLTELTGQLAAAKSAKDNVASAVIQAQMDTINGLIDEAGKSDKQKALDAAIAAKTAADKAVSDAQAALDK